MVAALIKSTDRQLASSVVSLKKHGKLYYIYLPVVGIHGDTGGSVDAVVVASFTVGHSVLAKLP